MSDTLLLPLLDFKLMQGKVDVGKARFEAGRLRLEDLRYAGLLLSEASENPEIERETQMTGATPGFIIPSDV